MNATQLTITVMYCAVTAIGVVALAAVIATTRRSKREAGSEPNIEKMERGENWWAIMTVAILVILFAATFAGIPWLNRANADSTVQVRALQFAFVAQPASVPAGTIDFEVKSDDVSHGFALYDPDNVMVAQIKVLPNVTSTVTAKLDKPGPYTIRCLEFCGFNHHNMIGRIEVTQ